jgi:hypothetical protein
MLMVIWNHGEPPPEFEEEPVEEGRTLEIIIELEPISEPKGLIVEKPPEYVPMDDYLQKELERQEQERLSKMLPERMP